MRIPLALCAVALLISVVDVASADPLPPGNTASFSLTSGGIRVVWAASCPVANYWAVNVVVNHQNGDRANGSGYLFDNTSNQKAAATGDMVWAVSLAPGKTTETFQARVTLECPNGSTDAVIAEKDITIGPGCDPNLGEKAQREFDTAASLQKQAGEDLKDADKADSETAIETAKEGAKASGITATLKTAIHILEHAGKVTPVGAAVVDVADILSAIEGLREEILLGDQKWKRLTNDAKNELDQAARLRARALRDFRNAKPCLTDAENKLDKLLAEQKLAQDAQRLIDGWEHNSNGTQYISAISHEQVDATTALLQAKRALVSGVTKAPIARSAAASVKANAKQLRAALSDVDRVIRDLHAIDNDLNAAIAANTDLLHKLAALAAG